jgi:peptidoglycan/xylan/chitin deacetylase (PgdA/CDA1 family)
MLTGIQIFWLTDGNKFQIIPMAVIINFHEINDQDWFENVVYFLKQQYKPVHLTDLINLYNSGSDLKGICHMTFDDGNKSFYNKIFPVLKKMKFPATTFISPYAAKKQVNFWFMEIENYDKNKLLGIVSDITGAEVKAIKGYPVVDILKCLRIEIIWTIINHYKKRFTPEAKSCQNMTVDEVREVTNSGLVTIGAHTMKHPILANEEDSVSKEEITSSLNELADIIGRETRYFAYPNGIPGLDFGQREVNTLKEINCVLSFMTSSGNFRLDTDIMKIPRYGISSGDRTCYIKSKLLLGSNWSRLSKLKPGNEFSNRRTLLKIFGAHSR